MTWAVDIAFYGAVAAYVAAAAASLLHLAGRRALGAAYALTAAGAGLLALVFALRWMQWGLLPLTTLTDSLNVLVLSAGVIILILTRSEAMRPLLAYYLPPLAPLCLAGAVAAPRSLHAAPRDLPELWLAVHVGLAFLAYALFFGASVTGLAYVVQTRRLKSPRLSGLLQRLPSLERLDRVLFRLIGYGYPFFLATVALGAVWAWRDSELLSASWWLSPKVFLSVATAVFYGMAFHSRRQGLLRGRKLAYFVCVGFAVLMAAYIALELTNLNTYNFWGAAS